MRVIFCGNPEFALPALDALRQSPHQICAVVTGADKPRGRGRKLSFTPVKEHALTAGIPVFQPEKLSDPDFLDQMRVLQPDVIVVVAFRILPRVFFALPPLGAFNIHPSLLPRGRGPAPLRWTLIRGETETGVTIIHLSEAVDAGDILLQECTPIAPDENYGSLHDRLAAAGARLLLAVLDAFAKGHPPRPLPQDESLVTKAPKLTASDYELDWSLSARDLVNHIRAFSPEPGAVTALNGKKFKILAANEIILQDKLNCGELKTNGRDQMIVGTGGGVLQLKMVQPEGKRPMTVADYLRGRPELSERFGK
ncbi:methionyl-tRNA formyltransferase [candidate division KSB1 bacterium]|nr:MAG: methionyl-tRNA formyltransferase [candidate division KSB1 bacterium]